MQQQCTELANIRNQHQTTRHNSREYTDDGVGQELGLKAMVDEGVITAYEASRLAKTVTRWGKNWKLVEEVCSEAKIK